MGMRITVRIGLTPMKHQKNVVNLYLGADLKAQAKTHAKRQYRCSLSELVQQLLVREMSLKRGLLKRAA